MASVASTSAASSGGAKISSVRIAKPFREAIKRAIVEDHGGVGPKLVGFLANDDPAAQSYAQWTKKACEADGIRFEIRNIAKTELEAALYAANDDPEVHGIMIYYPCFGGNAPCFYGPNMDDYLRDSISVKKDVEGLCYQYRRNLYRNERWLDPADEAAGRHKCLLPCTPLACVKVLEHLGLYDASLPAGDRLKGKVVTVVNRSEIVGRPLAAMIANDGAEVFSVDIDSIFRMTRGRLHETDETLETAAPKSHIIITGVPVKSYRFPVELIQPGTTFINVSSFRNIDRDELLKIEGVNYVPLVGKVTVAMLERNVLRLFENFHSDEARARLASGGGGGGSTKD
jgi:methylenetetrahydrofolate dehydrogenase (NAD+)